MGAHTEKTNLEMTRTVCAILDRLHPWSGHRYEELITFVADRPGHDFRYAVDPTKIARELGWKPLTDFAVGIERTVRWYLNRYTEKRNRES